uniref:Olfactomedin-like domain-containing protein n=1 Tax=Petromyzon marinus TaxID=7757 RepID=S4RWY6_PETMA
YTGLLQNLTVRVERMEQGHDRYTELDFELLRVEIREMEQLVQQLKLEVSSATLDRLHLSVSHDCRKGTQLFAQKHAYHFNIAWVNNKYHIYLKHKKYHCCDSKMGGVPVPHSAPSPTHADQRFEVIKIASYELIYSNWPSERCHNCYTLDTSKICPDSSSFIIMPPNSDSAVVLYRVIHISIPHLFIIRHVSCFIKHQQIGGIYIFMLNLHTNYFLNGPLEYLVFSIMIVYLLIALYINKSNYKNVSAPYIHILNMQGLWVIYSADGKVSLALLNDTSLAVINSWTTTQYKPSVSNGFMVCGVLYLTRTYSLKTEEIYFAFDSKTNQERYLSIMMDKPMEKMSSLSYNAVDRNLYMYDQGYMVTYNVISITINTPPV